LCEKPAEGPSVAVDGGYLVPYEQRVPGTEASFEMKPVPGGEFLLGSPPGEPGRRDDEGPQRRVRVGPMWVGAHEVTWAEYRAFMDLYPSLKRLGDLRFQAGKSGGPSDKVGILLDERPALAAYLEAPVGLDAVTCPTPLYDASFTYSSGEGPRQPAVTMTQFAAKQYTKWLSGVTGQHYRLPTEAEWEHAARAGSDTAYSFGEDASGLDDHAWHDGNADYETHPVGAKAPNAWGLYDVHGNAAEWVLDQYDAEHYAELTDGAPAEDAARWPTERAPRVVRGGSWQDEPEALRSAARAHSMDEDWALSDPNLPVSPWWYTEYESQAVGMRVVRPYEPMDADLQRRAWEPDTDALRLDIEDRLIEGRGVQAAANERLPAALKELPDDAD